MGILWSQQEKLAQAVTALQAWEADAATLGVHVAQVNLELLNTEPDKPNSTVIFEWDADAGEYAMRTT